MLNIQNLKPGEEVIMTIRRHWIVYLFIAMQFFISALFTVIVIAILGGFLWTYMGLIVFWLFAAMFLYIKWLDHELDLFVITNNRIIGVDQQGFLNRSLGECNLGQVQDMKSQTKGLFSNIFDYGTLTIQTAGNANNFQMDYAPKVIQTARKALNIVDDYRDREAGTNNVL